MQLSNALSGKIRAILRSLESGRNVLLYGPPATGKTKLISELFQALNAPPESHKGILLDLDNRERPFVRPSIDIPLPQPIKPVWTTFHQSYSYEDFVLSLRFESQGATTTLRPWSGVFLDAAFEVKDDQSKFKSVVIFIDEVNRGNAARIFGEFMTFLDFDYREGGVMPLPVPLRQLKYENGESEPIYRSDGTQIRLPEHFTFPKNVYIVATMNSVDRAAVPIDSALARRFDRIEMSPDMDVLADIWNLTEGDIAASISQEWHSRSPLVTAYLLLVYLNLKIASDLGPEFELGHGLMTSIGRQTQNTTNDHEESEEDLWWNLARVWDEISFPQLEDRYSGRSEQLLDLLKVDSPPPDGPYAWKLRTSIGGETHARALSSSRTSDLTLQIVKRSFRWLIH